MLQIRLCLHCKVPIEGRRDKKFCSDGCRNRANENKQNSYESVEKRNKNYRLFVRASRLMAMCVDHPPFERLGFIEKLIQIARSGEDNELRAVLSNRYLMDGSNDYGNPFLGKRGRSYGSLAAMAERYAQWYWKASIWEVVYCKVNEPPRRHIRVLYFALASNTQNNCEGFCSETAIRR